jgi:E3 ubiquitin-protein ligase MARCH6
MSMEQSIARTHFDGLITTLVGYMLLAASLILVYGIQTAFFAAMLHRARLVIGLSYIVIKVAILVVFEICVFPLVCGMWIDACTLRLFNATLADRTAAYEHAPGTVVFIHWLVGMVYVFYFATFVFMLREVFRPGVLWFLRNLNDPDFNPIQEMIQLPVYRHVRRFLTTVTIFGFTVVLLLLLPIKMIEAGQEMVEAFFGVNLIVPYNVAQTSETLSSELSIELLWLHAALPALLEQSYVREWTKNSLKLWGMCVSWLLGLRSYLMGEPSHNDQTRVGLHFYFFPFHLSFLFQPFYYLTFF